MSYLKDRDNAPAYETSLIADVQSFEGLAQDHVQGPVMYVQTPPVGGPHATTWQNCGFYAAPVANENATHSLEHGAVWIVYQSDLPVDQIEKLRELGEVESHVLVSTHSALPAPVVASAWENS